MATPLRLSGSDPATIARDRASHPGLLAARVDDGGPDRYRGSLLEEARPVLRVAATMAAIALCSYAAIFVAMLALLGAV
jgi:hypothetical protein